MKKAILGLSTLIFSLILTGCPDRIIDVSNFIEMECSTEDHFYFSKFNMPSEEELREFINQGKDISIYDIPNYYFEKKALILSLKSYEKFKKASVKVKFENPGEYKILLFSNLDEKEFFIRVTK